MTPGAMAIPPLALRVSGSPGGAVRGPAARGL